MQYLLAKRTGHEPLCQCIPCADDVSKLVCEDWGLAPAVADIARCGPFMRIALNQVHFFYGRSTVDVCVEFRSVTTGGLLDTEQATFLARHGAAWDRSCLVWSRYERVLVLLLLATEIGAGWLGFAAPLYTGLLFAASTPSNTPILVIDFGGPAVCATFAGCLLEICSRLWNIVHGTRAFILVHVQRFLYETPVLEILRCVLTWSALYALREIHTPYASDLDRTRDALSFYTQWRDTPNWLSDWRMRRFMREAAAPVTA